MAVSDIILISTPYRCRLSDSHLYQISTHLDEPYDAVYYHELFFRNNTISLRHASGQFRLVNTKCAVQLLSYCPVWCKRRQGNLADRFFTLESRSESEWIPKTTLNACLALVPRLLDARIAQSTLLLVVGVHTGTLGYLYTASLNSDPCVLI